MNEMDQRKEIDLDRLITVLKNKGIDTSEVEAFVERIRYQRKYEAVMVSTEEG